MVDTFAGGEPRRNRAAQVVAKTMRRGPRWFVRRVARELKAPSTPIGLAIRPIGFLFFRSLWRFYGAIHRNDVKDRQLWFFYDLDVAPVTFDICTFLAAAELQRRARGLETIQIVIVPGRHHGLRQEEASYERAMGPEARQRRVGDILVPATRMLASVADVQIATSRRAAAKLRRRYCKHLFPNDYEIEMPTEPPHRPVHDVGRTGTVLFPLFSADPADLERVRADLRATATTRRLVTITVRDYAFMPQRNSNLTAWLDFADSLDLEIYFPLFVPDTGQTEEHDATRFRGHAFSAAAAHDLGYRMALYEIAWLNTGIASGPMELCWYNESCRYMFFIETGRAPQTTPEFLRSHGIEPGEDLSFARPWQNLVWSADSFDNITRAFHEMQEKFRKIDQE